MSKGQNELLDKAKTIVDGSSLSDADKMMLLDRLPYAGSMILSMFVEVCEGDQFSTNMLVKNLKTKLDAQGNLTRIHEIIKQERVELENMLVAA